LEIHQLRYFCAVARTGNFTRAAEHEHVAQPSLSQQILKLEDELGARLFDRLGRRARLTPFGEVLLPRAQTILQELGEARSQVQALAGLESGQLVVGAIMTIAPYFLPPRLAGFSTRYPNIRLSIVEDTTAVLLNRLHEGSLDIALVALPVRGSELERVELMWEPLRLVVPVKHPLASQKSVSFKQIGREPFLLLKEGHCFRDTTIAACRHARLNPNVVFESGQFASILGMVAAGAGVSVVPEMAVEPRDGCTFLPLAERLGRRIGLVRLKNHFQTRIEKTFVDYLKKSVHRNGEELGHPSQTQLLPQTA
jgi:LysR family transcriptional regulator, hydrogen peroxide-inducible genes activator